MLKDAQVLEDYIVTMSNTVILGKQWQPQDSPEDLLRPTGLLMYTDRKQVRTSSDYYTSRPISLTRLAKCDRSLPV